MQGDYNILIIFITKGIVAFTKFRKVLGMIPVKHAF